MSKREKAIIVDENDEVVEYRHRHKLTPRDRIRITGVWIEDGKGNVLIAQRSLAKTLHPGLWGPAAAGGVAHDETYEQNAYKELAEEIGVKGIKLEEVVKQKIEYLDDRIERFCMWYRVVLDWPADKFILQKEEVERIKWVNKEDLFKDIVNNPETYVPSARFWPSIFS